GLAISSAWWILWAYPPRRQERTSLEATASRWPDSWLSMRWVHANIVPKRDASIRTRAPYLFMRKGPCLAIRRKMVQRRSQEYRFGLCAEAAGDSRSPFEASRSADTARRWSKCTLPVEQGRKSMECVVSELARRIYIVRRICFRVHGVLLC